MTSRIVFVVLIALMAVVQVQLWVGRGSVPRVAALAHRLEKQQAANAKAKIFNDQLQSEIDDLRDGLDTVEERARLELGMLKPNEIFVQVSRP